MTIMPKIMRLTRTFLLIICSALLGCDEAPETLTAQSVSRGINNTVYLAKENIEFNASHVGIFDDNLEIKISLDGEDDRSKIIRFAQINDKQPVTILESSIYIQKAINNQAKIAVKLQIAYQPEYDLIDKTDLTIVNSVFTHHGGGGGFHWSGTVVGCKNSDCSVYMNDRVPDIEQLSEEPEEHNIFIREQHKVTIIWDEDSYAYLFNLDDMQNRIDMRPYMLETKFDPENFRYARLSAEVSDIDTASDSARIVVRFGEVYVNGQLYDDFSAAQLDPEKWLTGQINQFRK
jgi:hypothetical protein